MFEQLGTATRDAYQIASDAAMRNTTETSRDTKRDLGVIREQPESLVLMEQLE